MSTQDLPTPQEARARQALQRLYRHAIELAHAQVVQPLKGEDSASPRVACDLVDNPQVDCDNSLRASAAAACSTSSSSDDGGK